MKAMAFARTGGPEVLQVHEMPVPQPGQGEVTIRVAYAGVNFAEVMARRGDYVAGELPLVPGFEVSGTIESIGEGVVGFRVGQRVAAMTVTGGYAEVAVASAAMTFVLDDSISLEQAAAFPTIVPTAWALLHEVARMREGESVLIHAAAGGVGTVAVQLARHLGASKVFGTVGSISKIAYACNFGFDEVWLREGFSPVVLAATGGRGVDVVLESVGGEVVFQSLDALAPLGRVVVFGNASNAPMSSFSVGDLWFANKSLLSYSIGHLSGQNPQHQREMSLQALDLLERGIVRIDITDTLPLEAAAQAHSQLETSATIGKMLLRVA